MAIDLSRFSGWSIPSSSKRMNCCGVRCRSGQDFLHLVIVLLLEHSTPLDLLIFLGLLDITQPLLVQNLSQQTSLIFLTRLPETVVQNNMLLILHNFPLIPKTGDQP